MNRVQSLNFMGHEIVHDDGSGAAPEGWYIVANDSTQAQGPYRTEKAAQDAVRRKYELPIKRVFVVGVVTGIVVGVALTVACIVMWCAWNDSKRLVNPVRYDLSRQFVAMPGEKICHVPIDCF